jgi:hypothetical protein
VSPFSCFFVTPLFFAFAFCFFIFPVTPSNKIPTLTEKVFELCANTFLCCQASSALGFSFNSVSDMVKMMMGHCNHVYTSTESPSHFPLTFPLSSHSISEDGVFWILLDFAIISHVYYSFGLGVWVGWDAHITA